MARDDRATRQPSGPSRSMSQRTRTPRKATVGAAIPAVMAPVSDAVGKAAGKLRRPNGSMIVTRRALLFFAVIIVLALSYAGSLRVYLVQGQELAAAHEQIEERTARVAELTSELARWNDPAYVKMQARDRLGWVMPGEIGYRVIGRDGKMLSGTTEIQGVGATRPNGLEAKWWDRLAGAIAAADEPEAVRP